MGFKPLPKRSLAVGKAAERQGLGMTQRLAGHGGVEAGPNRSGRTAGIPHASPSAARRGGGDCYTHKDTGSFPVDAGLHGFDRAVPQGFAISGPRNGPAEACGPTNPRPRPAASTRTTAHIPMIHCTTAPPCQSHTGPRRRLRPMPNTPHALPGAVPRTRRTVHRTRPRCRTHGPL